MIGKVSAYCTCRRMWSATGLTVEQAEKSLESFTEEHSGEGHELIKRGEYWEMIRQERVQCVPS